MLHSIVNSSNALFMGAMGATEIVSAGLDSMANNLASAMVAFRSKSVNSAFKAIKIVRYSCHYNFEWFIVIVPANFALCHSSLFH